MSDLDIFRRDRWRCYICGQLARKTTDNTDPRQATVDHIMPTSKGGSDGAENKATAHRICNTRKGSRYPWAPHTFSGTPKGLSL